MELVGQALYVRERVTIRFGDSTEVTVNPLTRHSSGLPLGTRCKGDTHSDLEGWMTPTVSSVWKAPLAAYSLL